MFTPCHRCIGGQLHMDANRERYCIQCGDRPDIMRYEVNPNPKKYGGMRKKKKEVK